jgi:hypothetical protein
VGYVGACRAVQHGGVGPRAEGNGGLLKPSDEVFMNCMSSEIPTIPHERMYELEHLSTFRRREHSSKILC